MAIHYMFEVTCDAPGCDARASYTGTDGRRSLPDGWTAVYEDGVLKSYCADHGVGAVDWPPRDRPDARMEEHPDRSRRPAAPPGRGRE
jgi:hypothetical protein